MNSKDQWMQEVEKKENPDGFAKRKKLDREYEQTDWAQKKVRKSSPFARVFLLIFFAFAAFYVYTLYEKPSFVLGLTGEIPYIGKDLPQPAARQNRDPYQYGQHPMNPSKVQTQTSPIYKRSQIFAQYLGDRNNDRAISQFTEIIEPTERQIKELNFQLANAYHQAGIVYLNDQDHKRAKEMLLKAALMTKHHLGDHNETALAFHNLATAYWGQHDFTSADVAYEEALRIYSVIYPSGHSAEVALRDSRKNMNDRAEVSGDNSNTNELQEYLAFCTRDKVFCFVN